ncbi:hypothetical protein MRB53_041151 [Persea americana]|nr:hypothetical protein MRB53_041151 [Persea americana]
MGPLHRQTQAQNRPRLHRRLHRILHRPAFHRHRHNGAPKLDRDEDRTLTLPLTLFRHALHPADPGWETSRRERVDLIAYFGQCFTGYDPHPGWIEEIKRRILRITPCDYADQWESGRSRNGSLW